MEFSVEWRRVTHGFPWIFTSPQLGGTLLVAERETRLVRLDPRTGEVLWDIASPGVASFAFADGVVVRMGADGEMGCIDLHDARERWVSAGQRFRSHISIYQDCVIAGGWRGYSPIQGFSLLGGGLLPPYRGRPPRSSDGLNLLSRGEHVPPHPTTGGILVSIVGSHELWLVEPRTAVIVQRWTLPAPIASKDGAAVFVDLDPRRVVFGCEGNLVVSVDIDQGVEVLWHHGRALTDVSVVIDRDEMWVFDTDGASMLSIRTGELLGSVRLPEPGVRDPVALGKVTALGSRSGALFMIGPGGLIVSRRQISRRLTKMVGIKPGLVHVETKSEVMCLS